MRNEKDIKAGLTEAEAVIKENFIKMDDAIAVNDYVRVYNHACEIMIASLAITAVSDACFGEDRPKVSKTKSVNDIVVPEFIKDWNKQF